MDVSNLVDKSGHENVKEFEKVNMKRFQWYWMDEKDGVDFLFDYKIQKLKELDVHGVFTAILSYL